MIGNNLQSETNLKHKIDWIWLQFKSLEHANRVNTIPELKSCSTFSAWCKTCWSETNLKHVCGNHQPKIILLIQKHGFPLVPIQIWRPPRTREQLLFLHWARVDNCALGSGLTQDRRVDQTAWLCWKLSCPIFGLWKKPQRLLHKNLSDRGLNLEIS